MTCHPSKGVARCQAWSRHFVGCSACRIAVTDNRSQPTVSVLKRLARADYLSVRDQAIASQRRRLRHRDLATAPHPEALQTASMLPNKSSQT